MERPILARITFGPWPENPDDTWLDELDHAYHGLIGNLRHGGQIICDPNRGVVEGKFCVFAQLAGLDALDPRHCSHYALKYLAKLKVLFGQEPVITILDHGSVAEATPIWQDSPWLALLGSCFEIRSPLCAPNRAPIPAYHFPIDAIFRQDLFRWAACYESHHNLWLASGSLEKETYAALADPRSPFLIQARGYARRIEIATGKPVYTELFRYHGHAEEAEAARPCPLCGQPWQEEDEEFPFRCHPCRLISTICPGTDEDPWSSIGSWPGAVVRETYETYLPAAADTLRGLIQRGRGRGLLQAATLPPETVWSLIGDSLWNDPRVDRQLEYRDWYLGTLIQRTGMPAERLTAILRTEDPSDPENPNQLAREVLTWLAGNQCPGATDALLQLPAPEQSPDAGDPTAEPLHEPFSIPALIAPYQDLCLKEIINMAADRYTWALGPAAAAKVTPADRPWLLDRLGHTTPTGDAIILRALAEIADPSLLPAILPLLPEKNSFEKIWPACLIESLRHFLHRLPPEATLPLAREWIEPGPFDWLNTPLTFGESLLASHAQPADLAQLLRHLQESLPWDESRTSRLISLLQALARLSGIGPQPLVERAYQETQSAIIRRHAALAMAAHSPAHFAQHYAAECLHDSDAETRALARQILDSIN